MSHARKLLVTRTDRLGDVLLALPALEYLRRELPSWSIALLCQAAYLPVISPYLASRQIEGIPRKFPAEIRMRDLREYDAALLLNSGVRLLIDAWRARIPLRVGPLSKPLSFVWLNKGLVQHRSLSEKNEAEYNLDLAKHLVLKLKSSAGEIVKPHIHLGGDEISGLKAKRALADIGVIEESKFIVVHPGMGGSAENLKGSDYAALIEKLSLAGMPVVLTIGPASRDYELAYSICHHARTAKILSGVEISVLREVFRKACLVIAPSTGPLHLAHLAGSRTVGLYSPVRSQHPNRWAPWGGCGKSAVLVPEVACPGTRACIGAKCEHFYCMSRQNWGDLILGRESDLMPAKL